MLIKHMFKRTHSSYTYLQGSCVLMVPCDVHQFSGVGMMRRIGEEREKKDDEEEEKEEK